MSAMRARYFAVDPLVLVILVALGCLLATLFFEELSLRALSWGGVVGLVGYTIYHMYVTHFGR